MKIRGIETIPVRGPLKPGLTTRTAHGDHVTSDYVLVEVHTDEGLAGLGETTVSATGSGETSRTCISVIQDYLEPALLGRDPRDLNAARLSMDRALKANPFSKASVEMALWDITGKSLG